MEEGEEFRDTATREVLEETGAAASIIKYIGKSQYTFTVPEDTVEKLQETLGTDTELKTTAGYYLIEIG